MIEGLIAGIDWGFRDLQEWPHVDESKNWKYFSNHEAESQ